MTLTRLLSICDAYDKLGWSIQSQLGDVVQQNEDKCNARALELITKFLHVVKKHADINGDDELREDAETYLANIASELERQS
jgi:hypothetical protein